MDDRYLDLLYLVACGANQERAERSRIEKMDIPLLERMAKRQSLTVITYMGMESSGILEDAAWRESLTDEVKSCLDHWKQAKDKGIRKSILFDVEREKIYAYFEQNQIWYMPLKGIVLKDMYPVDGMREMADNDILFDASKKKQVKEYFVEKGYEVVSYDVGNHDVYKKNPVYNFEMHRALYDDIYRPMWFQYYDDVKTRLLPVVGTSYEYRFNDEDFYIYFVTHTSKHHEGIGTGIRSLLDCYLCQKATNLQWDYIEKEMEKLGLLEFEKIFRKAAIHLFQAMGRVDSLEKEEYKLVCDMIGAGTYGNVQSGAERRLRKIQPGEELFSRKTKLKYFYRRFIPDKEYLMLYQPLIYKLKFPIPFFVVYRIIKGIIVHGRKLLAEAMVVLKAEK